MSIMRSYGLAGYENERIKAVLENVLFDYLKELSQKRLRQLCGNIVKRFASEKWNQRIACASFLVKKREKIQERHKKAAFLEWKRNCPLEKPKETPVKKKRRNESMQRLTKSTKPKNPDLGYEECTFEPKLMSNRTNKSSARVPQRACDYKRLEELHSNYAVYQSNRVKRQLKLDNVLV